MGTLNFHDVWLPTVLVQFPSNEEDMGVRVFPALKMGSSAGFVTGVLVPLAAFAVVAAAL